MRGRESRVYQLDDGYTPPKTVEQTRRLVEEEGVLGIFGSLGHPTSAATQRYLNKVPQQFLFISTSRFRDPEPRISEKPIPGLTRTTVQRIRDHKK